ncbi:selenium-dependent molybdenum cofactor biosynthesis protein YqeB [Sporomusa sp.]|uniref:selenium-dependent molybdenum cofactor biosynthesis protein YqeB n=1 Tax=Sporomusa sp. TaxID=2078658 RepID=UPI002C92E93C|nr:selenium-dependent molybdenum cofactor biosynthesis protein YqeB [Sporomusa sp.]HWR41741.1 selenium-dependent molybdenum cofactor biosynthesis protein YqeB [Sporomusa sp.]
MNGLVVIKGGGDLATGIAHRLFQSGFPIVITEVAQPTVVRRTVAFAQAIFSGEVTVEGVRAKRTESYDIYEALSQGLIPVLIDPFGKCVSQLKPYAIVDAIIAKCNTGTALNSAPVVIGVGPGFTAGVDVGAVVETMRGHDLGRVYYEGSAIANTGIPGEIAGYTVERLLRSPATGRFASLRDIGDKVCAGEVVGTVSGAEVKAAIPGILRGLIQDGLMVKTGMKIGDVDPRCRQEHCYSISDKARAVAGGVLEALLHLG